jgi:condensin complex subunit 1
LRNMDARVDFDINEAIKLYDSDPKTIPTPEASQALQECEEDAESLSSPALINSELNPVVDAVAESPDAITRSSVFDTLQFLLKCVLDSSASSATEKSRVANHQLDLGYHRKFRLQL